MNFIKVLRKIKNGKQYRRSRWVNKYIQYSTLVGQIFRYTISPSGRTCSLYKADSRDLLAEDWVEEEKLG